ncbi:MAG: right-handed parallel beta-helix repeat-containing protein [Acidobacteriota bacterium]
MNERRGCKNRCVYSRVLLMAFGAVLIAGLCQPATAARLCVNQGGTSGCYAKINAAVKASSDNDTIHVARGIYKEDVVIGHPLSLVGANPSSTVIDATGRANGIYIDGIDNSNLANVVVTGFTVENANFEGILATNASSVTIQNNQVVNNNRSLDITTHTCPRIPDFETAEGEDCGEGIHLIGVSYSVVAGNTAEGNSGGILISDETAATHDNVITGNVVRNNPFDCGITLASHPPASGFGSTSPFGIYGNTIANNDSIHNGYQVPGAGAGVGIFSFLSGGTVTENVVIGNQLANNGLPGVAMHAHSPGENLNSNVIVGNQISGNGADTDDAATPGPTGINVYGVSAITGTVISHNVIKREAVGVAVKTGAQVDVHLNNLLGQGAVGVDNLGSGTVNATANWWGCSSGPGDPGCSSVSGSNVLTTPSLATSVH